MTVMIEHKGMTKNLVEWAKYYGVDRSVMHMRYKRHGNNPDKLFAKFKSDSISAGQLFNYRGRSQTLNQWADELKIPRKALEMRARRGVRGEDLFKPVRQWCPRLIYKG